jgi:glycolate oxidase iron-sulfur subunit
MTACPSGVDYGKLIEATRAQIERKYDRGWFERVYRRLIFGLFTRPDRLRMMRIPLVLYQRFGLRKLVRGSGVLQLLPKRLQAMEALLPELPAGEEVAEVTPAVGEKRRRVGMLLGCVQREFLPQVNAATARVLAAEGCEVVSPAAQPCCGALLVHAGEEQGALALARHLINVFERAEVDTFVTNAAGCGSNMKEYGHLLRDDPNYAERAKKFSAKCKDVSEVLADLPSGARRNALRLKVAFHDSCHLQHAQGVRAQPRNLLAAIPELELLEIPEAAICCGSAGIYNLVQPDAANALGDRKAELIASLDADLVVTGNPGCILQLQASLERAGKRIPVLHTIQLLDASIRGQLLSALRK